MKRLLTLFLCAALLTGCTALPGEERSFALCLGIHAAGASVEATVLLPNYKGDNDYLPPLRKGGEPERSAHCAFRRVSQPAELWAIAAAAFFGGDGG